MALLRPKGARHQYRLSTYMYLHAAAGERDGVAIGAAAAERRSVRVVPRAGAVARVRHVSAIHRTLAMPVPLPSDLAG